MACIILLRGAQKKLRFIFESRAGFTCRDQRDFMRNFLAYSCTGARAIETVATPCEALPEVK